MFVDSVLLAAVRKILEFVGVWTSQDNLYSQTVIPADGSTHYFQFAEHVYVIKLPVFWKTHSSLKDSHIVASYQICFRRKEMQWESPLVKVDFSPSEVKVIKCDELVK